MRWFTGKRFPDEDRWSRSPTNRRRQQWEAAHRRRCETPSEDFRCRMAPPKSRGPTLPTTTRTARDIWRPGMTAEWCTEKPGWTSLRQPHSPPVRHRQKHPHQHNHVRVKNTVAATALVAWLPTFDDVFVVFIIDCNSLSTDVKIYYLVTNCLVLVKAHHLYSATNNKLQLQRCFASQTERAYRPLAKSHAHGTLDLAAKYHTQPRSAV